MTKKNATKRRASAKAKSCGLGRSQRLTETHLGMPIEQWRLKKRQQWQAVKNAMELFTYGSAYVPTGCDLYEMQKAADRIDLMLREDWVAW